MCGGGSDERSVEVLPVEHVRHAGVAVRHAELVPGRVAGGGDRVAHGDHRDVVKLVQRLHVPARTAPAADDAYCQSCHLPPLSLTVNHVPLPGGRGIEGEGTSAPHLRGMHPSPCEAGGP